MTASTRLRNVLVLPESLAPRLMTRESVMVARRERTASAPASVDRLTAPSKSTVQPADCMRAPNGDWAPRKMLSETTTT